LRPDEFDGAARARLDTAVPRFRAAPLELGSGRNVSRGLSRSPTGRDIAEFGRAFSRPDFRDWGSYAADVMVTVQIARDNDEVMLSRSHVAHEYASENH